jgi:hypothetical protein
MRTNRNFDIRPQPRVLERNVCAYFCLALPEGRFLLSSQISTTNTNVTTNKLIHMYSYIILFSLVSFFVDYRTFRCLLIFECMSLILTYNFSLFFWYLILELFQQCGTFFALFFSIVLYVEDTNVWVSLLFEYNIFDILSHHLYRGFHLNFQQLCVFICFQWIPVFVGNIIPRNSVYHGIKGICSKSEKLRNDVTNEHRYSLKTNEYT